MKRSKFKTLQSTLLFSLLALAIFTGTMNAANLLQLDKTSITLTCNLISGPGTLQTVNVKPIAAPTGSATLVVALNTAPTGVTIGSPSIQTFSVANNNSSGGINYTFNAAAACASFTSSGSPVAFKFKAGGVDDVTLSITTVFNNSLTVTPSISLSCNTITGPGPAQTVNVKPAFTITGTNTLAVTLNTAPAGIDIVPPATTVLSVANGNLVTGINYTFSAKAACASFPGTPVTFKFKAAGADDGSVAITENLGSNLVVSPSPVALTCLYTTPGGTPTWTADPAQTVNVTSGASSVAYTVDPATKPSWLSLSSMTGTTNGSFTAQAVAGCQSVPNGTTVSTQLHLQHDAATHMADRVVTITLKTVVASSLTLKTPAGATVSKAAITYAKGSGVPGFQDVVVGASGGGIFFSVDTSSLPMWLTIDSMSGNVSSGLSKSLRLSSTSAADTLAPGSYTGRVVFKVSGQEDQSLPVTLQVNNAAAKLTVSEGQTRQYNWTVGDPLQSYYVTLVSSGSAIPYSITTGGPLAPIVNAKLASGIAYSFGTPIPVTFSPDVFAAAQAGTTLTGTVSIAWGNPSVTTVVTFNIAILSPGATLSTIYPAALPTSSSGANQVLYLTGTGFVPSTDPNQKTSVRVWNTLTSTASTNPGLSAEVINTSLIKLTITVPASTDTALGLPFSAGGQVYLAVCNPITNAQGVVSCTVGSNAYTSFSIGNGPNIQTVTSASAFTQVSSGSQKVSPYDMLSIFGFNFCTTCTSSQVLYGTPDAVTLRFPTSLYPDPSNTSIALQVGFYQSDGTTLIALAPLLFATNTQINVVVPGTIPVTGSVVIKVSFNGVASSPNATSTLSAQKTNPGIFTVGSDGQGDGAILDQSYAVVGANNPAAARTGAESDTIAIYMTGLGIPDSDASGSGYEANCIATATYTAALGAATGTSTSAAVDGDVILRSLLPSGKTAPCIKVASPIVPTVKIGGATADVSYAGWVADSIAGLYQVNVKLPATDGVSAGGFTLADGVTTLAKILQPVQLPLVVRANGVDSQAGVGVWIAPRLKVLGPTKTDDPSTDKCSGAVGKPWPSASKVVATLGNGTYRYIVSSGTLPAGLSLNTVTNEGVISGVPGANTAGTYYITVTATDGASFPVSGTVSFTLTVNGGLMMTMASPGPFNTLTFGTPDAAINPQVYATGGTYPYTFALTAPSPTLPKEMTIDTATGIVGISDLTPAGTYNVTVEATDSTLPTPLKGTINFVVKINLAMNHDAISTTTTALTGGSITTFTPAGGAGGYTYDLDAPSKALGFAISAGGVVSYTPGTATATGYTLQVTATAGSAPTGGTAATTTVPISVTLQ